MFYVLLKYPAVDSIDKFLSVNAFYWRFSKVLRTFYLSVRFTSQSGNIKSIKIRDNQ